MKRIYLCPGCTGEMFMDELEGPMDVTCPHCRKVVSVSPETEKPSPAKVAQAAKAAQAAQVALAAKATELKPADATPSVQETSVSTTVKAVPSASTVAAAPAASTQPAEGSYEPGPESAAEKKEDRKNKSLQAFMDGSTVSDAPSVEHSSRAHTQMIYFLKCLTDVFNFKKTIAVLFLMLLPYLIFSGSDVSGDNPINSFPVSYQVNAAADMFLLITFIWLAGLPLAAISGATGAGLISTEVKEGTMLLMVSKPLKRSEILGYKYLASVIYCFVLISIAYLLSMGLYVNNLGVNFAVMEALMKFYPWILMYGLVVILLFSSIGAILSIVLGKTQKAVMAVVLLTMLTYLGFFMLRMFIPGQMFEGFYIFTIDIGYHLGNVYVGFLGLSGLDLSPTFQQYFTIFSGVYDVDAIATLEEPDQGFTLPSLPLRGLMPLWAAMLIWTILPLAVLVTSFQIWKSREVYF